MQKMKFCVNVHMRILTHMLKKGVWGNSPASGNWAPSCDACYPRKRRFPGACFSLLRQAAQNKKVPSGTIFWRRTVWRYLGQCAIILLVRIEQVRIVCGCPFWKQKGGRYEHT